MSENIKSFFVGSYNYSLWSQTANGNGISVAELDTSSGEMQLVNSFTKIKNPSYLAVKDNILYAVEETPQDLKPRLCAFLIKKNCLESINSQRLKGSSACHISINSSKSKLAVSNYSSASLELFQLLDDGSIANRIKEVRHSGKSINKKRQEASHIHSSVFTTDDSYLLVADLGIDQVVIYKDDGNLIQKLILPAGSGPRHLTWHKNNKYLFIINELNNTISICLFKNGSVEIIDTISTLAHEFSNESYASAIKLHPNGNYLYASNRGEDSITVFNFDEQNSSLKLIQTISSQGKFPRDIELSDDGQMLLVANQNSNNIYSYFVNKQTGLLSKTGQGLSLGTPVCIVF